MEPVPSALCAAVVVAVSSQGDSAQCSTPTLGDDATLLDPLLAGEPTAFEALYRRYVQLVYGFCRRRCDDAQTAEDAVSLVFLEVWRHRSTARLVGGSLRPWLLRVALNVVQNQNRAARRYRAATARYNANFRPVEPDVETSVVHAASVHDVHIAIRRLSKKLQVVAQLAFVDELPMNEVAAILAIPESTVRSRAALARTRLRSMLHSGDVVDARPYGGPLLSEFQRGTSERASEVSVQ